MMRRAAPRKRALLVTALAALAYLAPRPDDAPQAQSQNPPAISCDVADFSLAFRIYMPLTGKAGALGVPDAKGVLGSLEIFHQKVPQHRRSWSLDGRAPVQLWNLEDELKMMLLVGPLEEPVILIIDTRRRQAFGQHRGDFRLLTNGLKLTGKLACTVG